MDVKQVLHMNEGNGETSYAKNSTMQGKIISMAKPILEEAILKMLSTQCEINHKFPKSLGIADLGCSSGPNALRAVSEICNVIRSKLHHIDPNYDVAELELWVFLNDLPANDFNTVFQLLPEFYSEMKTDKGTRFGQCFVLAVPGSFYDRLFPSRSLHCVHSSSSLHWLSQVPRGLIGKSGEAINKGKIHISKSSPKSVVDAYYEQFKDDFGLFLKSRSEEIVGGGCMVLSLLGRTSSDPTIDEACYQWDLLAEALMYLASQGQIEEQKIDTFDVPLYCPTVEELKLVIEKEGSFIFDRFEATEIKRAGGVEVDMDDDNDGGRNDALNNTRFGTQSRGHMEAKTRRAVMESMLKFHFGTDLVMDSLFQKFQELLDDYLPKSDTLCVNLVLLLVRKDN